MRENQCDFGCDPSMTKGTSLGEQSTLSFVFHLPHDGFSRNFISRIFHDFATQGVSVVQLEV
jgi:hypothetical protein